MIRRHDKLKFFCYFSALGGPGIHWFVLLCRKVREYECFDSLGQKRAYVTEVLKEFSGHCTFNETVLQSQHSNLCGQFCFFFAAHRYFNDDLTFHELLEEIFSTNIDENEKEVRKFVAEKTKKIW